MDNPISAYSWDVISDSIAVKHMDKSAFLHHGTGIPKEISFFFDLTESDLASPKYVTLEASGKKYDAHFQMDPPLERFRLFWKSDFSNLIKNKYTEFHKLFSSEEEFEGETPHMRFERIRPDVYHIDFMDPTTTASDWSDEELETSINAYFEMLAKELRGEPYNKAEVNRKLRESILKNRSKGSVEFRMQNISSVLQGLCHSIIKGYLPRGNVGTEVSERIKKIIFQKKLLLEDDYEPTSDPDELNDKVESILEKGLTGKPAGQIHPRKQQSLQTVYERDPLVKAWVIQNAGGICELCKQQGPFKDKSDNHYLESHHVVSLSQGGPDTIENAVALCPNCHKRCHYAHDLEEVRAEMENKIRRISGGSSVHYS